VHCLPIQQSNPHPAGEIVWNPCSACGSAGCCVERERPWKTSQMRSYPAAGRRSWAWQRGPGSAGERRGLRERRLWRRQQTAGWRTWRHRGGSRQRWRARRRRMLELEVGCVVESVGAKQQRGASGWRAPARCECECECECDCWVESPPTWEESQREGERVAANDGLSYIT
jgi:hypothetical protein